mgnify:CR=1 FL=1
MKMKEVTFVVALAITPTLALAWPWSQDMMNQPSIKPQEGPPALFPARSIPITGQPTKVKDRQEAESLDNPIAVSEASLKKGRTLFRIICSACHGLTGKADAPVGLKMGAIDLTSEYVQTNLTEGWIYGTITFGGAIMPAYGRPSRESGGSNDLSPEERWHVVNYVRNGLVKESAQTSQASAQ